MAFTLQEVRDSLALTLRQNLGDLVYTYGQVESKGNFPAIIVEPNECDFAQAMRGGHDVWDFNLFVLVSGSDDATKQNRLDEFVTGKGPKSIRQILLENSHLTLDQSVSAFAYKMRGYGGEFVWSGLEHIGAIIKVRVVVSN